MSFLSNTAARYLKNRKRHTILTEVGIVLSVVLMTVVLVAVSTVVRTRQNIISHVNGTYDVIFNDLTKDQLIQLSNMDIFSKNNKYAISYYTDEIYKNSVESGNEINYLTDENGSIIADSFLRIESDNCDMLPYDLTDVTEGRLPEKSGEIVISDRDSELLGVSAVGDTLRLVRLECETGSADRDFSDDEWYKELAASGYAGVPEELDSTYNITGAKQLEYTVVGFSKNYSIISYKDSEMGSAFTQLDKLLLRFGDEQNDFYWDMDDAFAALGLEIDDFSYSFNQDYLNSINKGVTARNYNTMMYILVYLAVFLIMFCVRMVIDNSFEISSHERIRQFGVLRAVGASKKQILGILIHEALWLSLFGVPVGLVLGCGFSAVIYSIIKHIDALSYISRAYDLRSMLEFQISPVSIVLAAVIGVMWVIISAVGTGMRVNKISPVEAMRAAGKKVRLRSREKKASGEKMGIERLIAFRSIRRNNKRYLITLVSMALSIVMFTGFSYALEVVRGRVDDLYSESSTPFDYELTITGDNAQDAPNAEKLIADSGLFSAVQYDSYIYLVVVADDNVNGNQKVSGYYYMQLHPVNSQTYKTLTGKDDYSDFNASGKLILCNTVSGSSSYQLYSNIPDSVTGNPFMDFVAYDEITVGIYGSYDTDMDMYKSTNDSIIACVSEDMFEKLVSTYGGDSRFTERTNDDGTESIVYDRTVYASAAEGMNDQAAEWLSKHYYGKYTDNYTQRNILEALLCVIRIGGYSAIAVLTLIAAVNIVNIISTNVLNRTAEIGMLRACGMSSKQIIKMVLNESCMYALISALASAAAVEIIIALIYVPFRFGGSTVTMDDMPVQLSFIAPLKYLLIASAAAFAAAACAAVPAAKRIINTPIVDAVEESE